VWFISIERACGPSLLPHRKPLAAVLVQFECRDGGSFRGAFVNGLHRSEARPRSVDTRQLRSLAAVGFFVVGIPAR